MSELIRIGVSMDGRLLARLDQLIAEKGYSNRSEAIRDLIRGELVEQSWEEDDEETVGTITLVYDHEMGDLTDVMKKTTPFIACTARMVARILNSI